MAGADSAGMVFVGVGAALVLGGGVGGVADSAIVCVEKTGVAEEGREVRGVRV